MELIKNTKPEVIVVLVGNKLDLIMRNQSAFWETRVKRVIRELFPRLHSIQFGIEISALQRVSTQETLQSAVHLLEFPIKALINMSNK